MVVEEYRSPKEYTEFAVTVLGTAKGPVALMPTEVSAFNMADDIDEAELDNQAYLARQEVKLIHSAVCHVLCFRVTAYIDRVCYSPAQCPLNVW